MSKWSLHKADHLGYTFTVMEGERKGYRIQVTYEALAHQYKLVATEANALGVAKQRYERMKLTRKAHQECIKMVEEAQVCRNPDGCWPGCSHGEQRDGP